MRNQEPEIVGYISDIGDQELGQSEIYMGIRNEFLWAPPGFLAPTATYISIPVPMKHSLSHCDLQKDLQYCLKTKKCKWNVHNSKHFLHLAALDRRQNDLSAFDCSHFPRPTVIELE